MSARNPIPNGDRPERRQSGSSPAQRPLAEPNGSGVVSDGSEALLTFLALLAGFGLTAGASPLLRAAPPAPDAGS